MKAWRADPLVWGQGPASSRCSWNRPARFLSRLSANSKTCSTRAGEDRITVKVRLQSQPWHMYSGVIVRCILAASTLEGGKTAAKSVMAAVAPHRAEFEFDDGLVQPDMSSGDPIADWVARLSDH